MSIFESWLTLRVALCIVAGVALGDVVLEVFHAIGVWIVNRSKGWYERGQTAPHTVEEAR